MWQVLKLQVDHIILLLKFAVLGISSNFFKLLYVHLVDVLLPLFLDFIGEISLLTLAQLILVILLFECGLILKSQCPRPEERGKGKGELVLIFDIFDVHWSQAALKDDIFRNRLIVIGDEKFVDRDLDL